MQSRGPQKVVICLLRNDLRYHDNEALHAATRYGASILPLYCWDPRHYKGTWHFDFPKTGHHRLRFLIDCIRDLRNTLQKHGSNLIVRQGKPEEVISDIIETLGKQNTEAIVFSDECTKEEQDVETAIKQCGVKVQTVWGSTLYHPEDIPFPVKQVPNVYTEFRKRVENQGIIRPVRRMPDQLLPVPEGINQGDIPDIKDFGCPTTPQDKRTAFPFAGGETTGLARLQQYLWDTDLVAKYKETRNGLIGPEYSTKFSTWLAHGCLSPRQIYWEIKRYEKERVNNQSTYWVIFELLWRDYFKYVACRYGDRLFYRSGLLARDIPWKKDLKAFEAWRDGKTGVPFVDANMRELKETGFMSNRGRQNVASFLTKDLQLDWRLGAEWFESMLLDHDVCSNYGNWQYSAGIGNDPRQDRKFNMIKQAMDYDADGDYVRLWVPELAGLKGGDIHKPWMMSPTALERAKVCLGHDYPHPMLIAPEWNRDRKAGGRPTSGRGGQGGSRGRGKSYPGQKRGMDFYFSSK